MREENKTEIIVAPDHRLRLTADPVDLTFDNVAELVEKMFAVMQASDGIGLAATQVGINKRVIIMDVDHIGAYDDSSSIKHGKFVMINPTITERSGEARWKEGCLSVPGFSEDVTRSLEVTVTFNDETGEKRSINAGGLLAACIQHEIDHLDGVLFIDHISLLKKDIIVKKLKKFKKKGVLILGSSGVDM